MNIEWNEYGPTLPEEGKSAVFLCEDGVTFRGKTSIVGTSFGVIASQVVRRVDPVITHWRYED